MKRFIKSIVALVAVPLFIYATLLLIQLYIFWCVLWYISTMTGIGLDAVKNTQTHLITGWTYWRKRPRGIYRWTLH